MLQTERHNDYQESIRTALEGYAANMWTALPAIITSFNPEHCTVEARPAVQAQVRDKAGNLSFVEIKLLRDVPVVFPRGGSFVFTFPVQPGDEALVVFSSRCIDLWWVSGEVKPQAELRLHDLSDGFALIGPFSVPRVPSAISTDTAQIRTLDGTAMIELTASGAVNILAPGGVHVTGALTTTGEVTAMGTHTLTQHRHGGVQSGGSLTNTPTG